MKWLADPIIINPDIPRPNDNLLVNVISLFVWAIGVLSVVVLIYASFRLITAQGNVEQAKTARKMIIWSLVGLFLALSAGTILAVIIMGIFKT
jgi:hypothetical protein